MERKKPVPLLKFQLLAEYLQMVVLVELKTRLSKPVEQPKILDMLEWHVFKIMMERVGQREL